MYCDRMAQYEYKIIVVVKDFLDLLFN